MRISDWSSDVCSSDLHDVLFLPYNDEAALENAFHTFGEEISSVIIESIQGVGGIKVAHPSFLRKIRELTQQYNAVFIADEVQCGYGRSGEFYAQDISDTQADFYTMAKGWEIAFRLGE